MGKAAEVKSALQWAREEREEWILDPATGQIRPARAPVLESERAPSGQPQRWVQAARQRVKSALQRMWEQEGVLLGSAPTGHRSERAPVLESERAPSGQPQRWVQAARQTWD